MNDYVLSLRRIGTAFLIFVFNFNIGTLNLLPNFLGYILIYKSLQALEKYEKSISLMKPLTIALTIYSGITWLFTIFSISLNIYIIDLIFAIFSIYVYYHLLTSVGQICESYNSAYTSKVLSLRNIITVIQTISSLFMIIINDELSVFIVIISIIYVFIVIYLKITLNRCAKEAEYL